MLLAPRNTSANTPKKGERAAGFTLVELLMVIAVILILAGITFGISRGVQNAQARAKVKAELANIAQGLEQFKATYGDYPWIAETTGSGNANALLRSLTGWSKLEAGATAGSDPTMQNLPLAERGRLFIDPDKLSLSGDFPPNADPGNAVHLLDPWGSPYVYIYNRSGGSWDNFGYVLFSSGPDGRESMTGADSDGLIDDTFRGNSTNVDNIFVGE